jgi:hypothetical protein
MWKASPVTSAEVPAQREQAAGRVAQDDEARLLVDGVREPEPLAVEGAGGGDVAHDELGVVEDHSGAPASRSP